ncbi:unnamed protein product [Didymodactylos carnosus]|uniref:Uncharacterized protein n=1 Tax=Didymodactylos carnosus TaxID=1234261 RepID=A0A8S2DVP9_9BILA|nr:unnamed protein product [Didymodactylos carnosus]CAF3789744.1 unnamed protein product [Didymodactylos carnosus]
MQDAASNRVWTFQKDFTSYYDNLINSTSPFQYTPTNAMIQSMQQQRIDAQLTIVYATIKPITTAERRRRSSSPPNTLFIVKAGITYPCLSFTCIIKGKRKRRASPSQTLLPPCILFCTRFQIDQIRSLLNSNITIQVLREYRSTSNCSISLGKGIITMQLQSYYHNIEKLLLPISSIVTYSDPCGGSKETITRTTSLPPPVTPTSIIFSTLTFATPVASTAITATETKAAGTTTTVSTLPGVSTVSTSILVTTSVYRTDFLHLTSTTATRIPTSSSQLISVSGSSTTTHTNLTNTSSILLSTTTGSSNHLITTATFESLTLHSSTEVTAATSPIFTVCETCDQAPVLAKIVSTVPSYTPV